MVVILILIRRSRVNRLKGLYSIKIDDRGDLESSKEFGVGA